MLRKRIAGHLYTFFLRVKRHWYAIGHGDARKASPGSSEWLISTEIRYGGLVTSIPRLKVSPNDPRPPQELELGGMTGGDRMAHHGYAPHYSAHLLRFLEPECTPTLIEIGILNGSGLAIWCDLFPAGRIIGLDIDLTHFRDNLGRLRRLGAFARTQPETYEFDQLVDNRDYLGSILDGDTVDICIDDGLHSDEAILKTIESVLPWLSARFVYFVEDNGSVHATIQRRYPDLTVETHGELTIISRNPRGEVEARP